jgi:hypothetical protein
VRQKENKNVDTLFVNILSGVLRSTTVQIKPGLCVFSNNPSLCYMLCIVRLYIIYYMIHIMYCYILYIQKWRFHWSHDSKTSRKELKCGLCYIFIYVIYVTFLFMLFIVFRLFVYNSECQ